MWPFEKKKKSKDRFQEEYQDYVKRKQRERKEPEHRKIKRMPTAEEIKKRALPKLSDEKKKVSDWIKSGVPGFDDLLEKGIPKGHSILVAGGPGSGKTIFCLETLNYGAGKGEKCLYVSFEESEGNLKKHMEDFGWNPDKLEKKGLLVIRRADPFDISTSVEALLAKAKGELMIELDELPGLFPEGFKPNRLVLDSLSALAAAFTGREESYRIYIEQLFRYLEKSGVTSFLITETEAVPTKFSTTGVEEFLADGVIVLYNIRRGSVRERAIEVLKLRGAKHKEKIVAFELTDKGMVVYPDQEILAEIEESKTL